MRPFCLLLALLAVLGLGLSAMVHVSTFLGIEPTTLFPAAWLLHLGIFALIIPLVLIQKKQDKVLRPRKGPPFADAPRWMNFLVGFLFLYAFVNFAVNMMLMPGKTSHAAATTRPQVETSSEELQRRHQENIYGPRLFSGHWMLFYAAAGVGLYSIACRKAAGSTSRLLHPRPN